MLKTVLAVIGVVGVLALVVVVGGGYFAYKKGTSAASTMMATELNKFIATKNPPENVAGSLRRLMNATKMHPSLYTTPLLSIAYMTTGDGVVTTPESSMIDDAAALAEKDTISSKELGEFMRQHDAVIQSSRMASAASRQEATPH